MISRLFAAFSRIRGFVIKSRLDRELQDEMTTHIDLATEDNISRGMDPASARREALRRFGGRDAAVALEQDSRGLPLLENFLRDIAYGMRQLRRNPLFTLTVVLTLAIGMGANTTVFTVANALLFRKPAGVADPGSLVDIGVSFKGDGFGSGSYPNYLDIRDRATTLNGIYAHTRFPGERTMESAGTGNSVERVFATQVLKASESERSRREDLHPRAVSSFPSGMLSSPAISPRFG